MILFVDENDANVGVVKGQGGIKPSLKKKVVSEEYIKLSEVEKMVDDKVNQLLEKG